MIHGLIRGLDSIHGTVPDGMAVGAWDSAGAGVVGTLAGAVAGIIRIMVVSGAGDLPTGAVVSAVPMRTAVGAGAAGAGGAIIPEPLLLTTAPGASAQHHGPEWMSGQGVPAG